MRLVAVAVPGLLVAGSAVLGVRLLLFAPAGLGAFSTVLAVFFGAAAVAYFLLARAVARQSRVGDIVAIASCGLGALLSVSAAMTWPDWAVLGLNVAALGLLVGCVPRRPPA